MPSKKPVRRKRRTREHVIADLSVNHVERHVLLCGFAVQRVVRDYGIDLFFATFDPTGHPESGEIRVQIKATDHLKVISDGGLVAVRVQQADLRQWLLELMPVILVIYDAQAEIAYWVYVQAYFDAHADLDLDEAGDRVTVRIPRSNVLNQAAVRQFALFRDQVFARLGKGARHG